MRLPEYICSLKEQHADLNNKKDLTKEEKIIKLLLKDKIYELELQMAEEYWSR
tara:strand:+ start:16726 stop:16884 length:159 start_codon:yes stop_codon:yes gene_type:complete